MVPTRGASGNLATPSLRTAHGTWKNTGQWSEMRTGPVSRSGTVSAFSSRLSVGDQSGKSAVDDPAQGYPPVYNQAASGALVGTRHRVRLPCSRSKKVSPTAISAFVTVPTALIALAVSTSPRVADNHSDVQHDIPLREIQGQACRRRNAA